MGYRITIEMTDEPGLVINTQQEASPAPAPSWLVKRRLRVAQLLGYFDECAGKPPVYFLAADIARAVGVNASEAGRLLQEVVPVHPRKGKGYASAEIYAWLDERMAELPALGNGSGEGVAELPLHSNGHQEEVAEEAGRE